MIEVVPPLSAGILVNNIAKMPLEDPVRGAGVHLRKLETYHAGSLSTGCAGSRYLSHLYRSFLGPG